MRKNDSKKKSSSKETKWQELRLDDNKVLITRGDISDTMWRAEYGYLPWTVSQLEQKPSDWDDFYDLCFNAVPKLSSIIVQNAEMASGFRWVSTGKEADKAVELLNSLISNINILLRHKVLEGMIAWQKYGRVYYDPMWSDDFKRFTLKMPDPRSIRPIRDNKEDLDFASGAPSLPDSIKEIAKKPTYLGIHLGFIQTLGDENIKTTPKKYLAPSKLIFIPRYPQPDQPNGVSVFRSMYMTVTSKLGYEDTQGKMVRRWADPARTFIVGNDRVPCYPDDRGQHMIDFVEARITAAEGGVDLFLPDWVKLADPPPYPRGLEAAVNTAQSHNEENNIIGAGSFPALLSAEGYRGSAQEVRNMLEFKAGPIRDLFQAYFTDRLIKPFLDAHLGTDKYEMPLWVWDDITPEEMNDIRQSLSVAYQAGWMDPNDCRRIHGGLSIWSEEKVQMLQETKQAEKRPDRLEAPSPDLKNRIPIGKP